MASKKIRKYTVDASVAVKWFADEEDSDKASSLKAQFVEGVLELSAPTLLSYEVANALRWHPLVKMGARDVTNALMVLDSYQFLNEPTIQAWSQAIQLSYSHHISIYDSIYVGFARTMDSQLVTADEKLIEMIPATERQRILILATMELS